MHKWTKLTLLSAAVYFGTAHANSMWLANNPTATEQVVVQPTSDFQATVYQGLGYRYDHQKTKFYYFGDPSILNTVSELKDRNTIQTVLGANISYKNFFFLIQGDYGWLINGTQDIINPGNNVDEPTAFTGFHLGSGYTTDIQAAVGYDIRLVKTEGFRFGLVPAVGYKYWHMMNWREGEKRFDLPSPPIVLPPILTGFALDRQQRPDQQDWFGTYVQAGLSFKWFERARLDLFYQYHFMNLRTKNGTATDLYTFFPANTLVAQQTYRYDINTYSNHVYAQVGSLDFAYLLTAHWQLGLQFEGSQVWSHRATTKIKTVKEEFVLPPVGTTTSTVYSQTKISWTSYKANAYIGYAF